MNKRIVLKDAGVLLIVLVMVLSTVMIVAGNTTKNGENTDSSSYDEVKSIEGSEIFSQLFDRYTMTCIPAFSYYRRGNSLRACVSADGGITWHVSDSTYEITALSDPPTVEITNPEDGDDVSGTVTITADASDDVGVSKVTFSIDSGEIGYDDTAPYMCNWDTTTYSDGWYTITATAYDNENNTGSDSINVCVGGDCDNHPPETPSKPSGPTTGEPGVEYTYTTSTTDPDDDWVRYGWEWTQDNTVDGWTNFYNSGAQCSVKLVFDDPGTYYLRVKAEDELGAQSGFSPTLTVVISEECGEFMGFQVCSLGQAELDIGDELVVSNIGSSGYDGVDIDIASAYNTIKCDMKEDSGIPIGTSFLTEGVVDGVPDQTLSMCQEKVDDYEWDLSVKSDSDSYEVMAFLNDEIVFYETVDASPGIWFDVGTFGSSPSLGILLTPDTGPYGMSISNISDAGIAWSPGDGKDVKWTWDEVDVSDLVVDSLMLKVRHDTAMAAIRNMKCYGDFPSDGEFTITGLYGENNNEEGYVFAEAIGEAVLTPVDDGIIISNVGPSGNDGVLFTPIPTYNDVKCTIDLDDISEGGETRIKYFSLAQVFMYEVIIEHEPSAYSKLSPGVHPVSFNGTASGAPSIIAWKDDIKVLEAEIIDGLLGAFVITDYTLGVHPVSFNGTASGAPSIIAWYRGDGEDEEFPWEFNGVIYYVDYIEIIQPDNDYPIGIGEFTVTAKVPIDLSTTTMNTGEFTITHIRASDPPDTPDIDGPTSGKAGEECTYSISAYDPNGNSIYYRVNWGDGTGSGWLGPYNSGETSTTSHTWSAKGSYTVTVKAKDIHGFESDWATLSVSMPKNKAINPFINFLENHPNMFPLLRQLLRL